MAILTRRLPAAAFCLAFAVVCQPLSALAQSCDAVSNQVYGGVAADPETWPFVASIQAVTGSKREGFCSGSVIAPNWVLTAAHCLHPLRSLAAGPADFLNGPEDAQVPGRRIGVTLGATQLGGATAANHYKVVEVVPHPDYARRAAFARENAATVKAFRRALGWLAPTEGDDLALLKLDRPFTLRASTLSANGDADPNAGASVFVAGFGARDDLPGQSAVDAAGFATFSPSLELRTAENFISGDAECRTRWAKYLVGPEQICSEHPREEAKRTGVARRGSCGGDSGGPLVAQTAEGCAIQVGTVSWSSRKCATTEVETVFMRVSAYRSWIDAVTGLRPTNVNAVADAGQAPAVSAAPDVTPPGKLNQIRRQLEALLGASAQTLDISLDGRTEFALGERIRFTAKSPVTGRLLMLGIDGGRKLYVLYPNNIEGPAEVVVLQAGAETAVPRQGAFQVVEPTGDAALIAVVFPPTVNLPSDIVDEVRTKSFQQVATIDAPAPALTKVVEAVREALESGVTAPGDWSYGIVEYTVRAE